MKQTKNLRIFFFIFFDLELAFTSFIIDDEHGLEK